MIISVKLAGKVHMVDDVTEESTVEALKVLVERATDVPASKQRLIFAGKVLKDPLTLNSYGIKEGSAVHLVPTKDSSASRPVQTATPQATPQAAGMPGMQDMMQNPDMMRAVLDNPMVQAMMTNPETLSALTMSHPQIRELVQRNPELAHVFNDPEVMRQALEMMRNPQLMREMQRNADRQLSNIEMMPEGFNALSSFYNQIQEPLERALDSDQPSDSASPASAPSRPRPTPNEEPLPNPWASATPPSTAASAPAPGASPFGAFPGFGSGAMPDMGSMLENPAILEQMSAFAQSNPEMVQSMMRNHPMMQQMANANPQVAAALNDPAVLQNMLNPANIRAMHAMRQAFGGGAAASSPPVFPFPPSTPQQPSPAPQPTMSPRDLYATQLQQMRDMGFTDEAANIRALQSTGGNVEAAIGRLFGDM